MTLLCAKNCSLFVAIGRHNDIANENVFTGSCPRVVTQHAAPETQAASHKATKPRKLRFLTFKVSGVRFWVQADARRGPY